MPQTDAHPLPLPDRGRNLATVARIAPAAAALVATPLPEGAPRIRQAAAAGAGPALWVDGKPAIPDLMALARQQLAAALDQPRRFFFKIAPERIGWSPVKEAMLDALFGWRTPPDFPPPGDEPPDPGGAAIVIGAGSGCLLPLLAEALPGRDLVVVEPEPLWLALSLDAIDWHDLAARLESEGRRLILLAGGASDQLAEDLYAELWETGHARLDGSFLFRGYDSPAIAEIDRRFSQRLSTLAYSQGFFEDEMKMMDHAGAILGHAAIRLAGPGRQPALDVPAFIVGSGPSLDRDIEVIRRWAPKAVLFGCSSGSGVLVNHGIAPDFHVEIENHPRCLEFAELYARSPAFADTALLAATTVVPGYMKLFARRLMFFRDGLSSTLAFAPGGSGFARVSPTVGNAAVTLALALGFRELYLFGLDFGSRLPDHHHSVDSLYNTLEEFKSVYFDELPAHSLRVPANFGGEVFANGVFLWGLRSIEAELARDPAAQVHNCCDGAAIRGAKPLLAGRLALDSRADKADIVARLLDRSAAVAPGDLIDPPWIKAFRLRLEGWYDGLLAALAGCEAAIHRDPAPMAAFDRAVRHSLDSWAGRDGAVLRAIHLGTLVKAVQLGQYFYLRLPAGDRAEGMRRILAASIAAVETMRRQLFEILDRLPAPIG